MNNDRRDELLDIGDAVINAEYDPYGVKFIKTHKDAVLPTANDPSPGTGDSGYDITAVEMKVIPAHGSAVVNVGLKLADVGHGFWLKIEARSGLGFKHGIMPHPGIIDNSYRGDCGVKLYNLTDKNYIVEKGDRIAQFVLYPLVQTNMCFTEEATETARGEKGFGSSGA